MVRVTDGPQEGRDKKLIEAGWLHGRTLYLARKKKEPAKPPRDGLVEDAEHLPPHLLAQIEREEALKEQKAAEVEDDVTNTEFIIFSENWLAWSVFWLCRFQWRESFGDPRALDYNVIYSTMDRMRVRNQIGTLTKIQFIEQGAVSGMAGVPRDALHILRDDLGVINDGKIENV